MSGEWRIMRRDGSLPSGSVKSKAVAEVWAQARDVSVLSDAPHRVCRLVYNADGSSTVHVEDDEDDPDA